MQSFATKVRIYIQDQPAFMDGVSDITVESEVSGRVDITYKPIKAFVIIDRPLITCLPKSLQGCEVSGRDSLDIQRTLAVAEQHWLESSPFDSHALGSKVPSGQNGVVAFLRLLIPNICL